jgi:uncharacterized protein involved in type VI secretion and phage assembly
MGTYKNGMFALRLAGGGFDDFYPYQLDLEEGLSRLFTGTLSILSDKPHTHEELLPLLDKGVTLLIRQKLLDGTVFRTRYLHGIVREVTGRGVLGGANKLECFGFSLTIESELARLRYTKSSRPYYHLTPADLIQQILDRHHIEAQFPGDLLKRNEYSQKLMFEQSRLADWDFLSSVLSMYGISWTLRHPRVKGDSLGKSELIFSEGKSAFPVSDIDYSDKRETGDKEQFDYRTFDERTNLWKMNSWQEGASIGVDGIELSALYPNANHGSSQWHVGETGDGKRFYNYNRQFHGYGQEAGAKEIDDDVMRILNARYRALQIAKNDWRGTAANLCLVPGRIFDLAHFYGMKSKEVISAMTMATRLRCRTPLPREWDMPLGDGQDELISVEAVCMDHGKNAEKRFCDSSGIME